MSGWSVERTEDGESVLTFGGLPFGQGFGLTDSLGDLAPDAYAAIADALARDAKVAEIVAEWRGSGNDPWPMTRALEHTCAIAALYPEAGK